MYEATIKSLLDSSIEKNQSIGVHLAKSMEWKDIDTIHYILNSNSLWLPRFCSIVGFDKHYVKRFLNFIFHIKVEEESIAFTAETTDGGIYFCDNLVIDDCHEFFINHIINPILIIVIESMQKHLP